MNETLLSSELVSYNTNETDNICPICLESINELRIILSPVSSIHSNSPNSENNFDLVSVDLESHDSSRQNSINDLWVCNRCNKEFHLNCIVDWKGEKKNFRCPYCRSSHILDIDIVNIDNNDVSITKSYCDNIENICRLLSTVILVIIFLFIVIISVLFTKHIFKI